MEIMFTKKKLLGKFYKRELKRICKKEGLSTSGLKREIINRLAKKLEYQKVAEYYWEIKKELKFNLFDHKLVPSHRILNKKEKKEILEKYNIVPEQLPKIRAEDPGAMVVGAKEGDIVEITRKSPTAGETKYYRLVIS